MWGLADPGEAAPSPGSGWRQCVNQPKLPHCHLPALLPQSRYQTTRAAPNPNLLILQHPFFPVETTRKAPACISLACCLTLVFPCVALCVPPPLSRDL